MLIKTSSLPKTLSQGGAQTPWGRMSLSWDSKTGHLCKLGFEKPGDFKAQKIFDDLYEGKPWKAHVIGTDFQLKVWNALLKIPQGQTMTYGEIAKSIGHPTAFRAVGTAVGSNPLAWLVPCHRVLPKSGGLGNYYWGPTIKEKILRAEGVLGS